MTYFTYNGRSSADFGLHIEKKDVFSAPEYDAEFISIPGRSGDIINPNRRFANIKVTYTVFLARKSTAALASVLRDIKGWLYSEPDRYHEITDSYDAEYFRYGVISGNLDIEEQFNKIGSFTVVFNCKPYKYSFAGQQTMAADDSTLTITNPTAFESRPYIKLYGSGTVALLIQPQGRGIGRSFLFFNPDRGCCGKFSVLQSNFQETVGPGLCNGKAEFCFISRQKVGVEDASTLTDNLHALQFGVGIKILRCDVKYNLLRLWNRCTHQMPIRTEKNA